MISLYKINNTVDLLEREQESQTEQQQQQKANPETLAQPEKYGRRMIIATSPLSASIEWKFSINRYRLSFHAGNDMLSIFNYISILFYDPAIATSVTTAIATNIADDILSILDASR